MEKFSKLGIIEPILKVLKEKGFSEPTEIQEKAIPLVLKGKDVIAGSATGSGKTLAFASGIIQNGERGKGIQALILTPTRELAEQVSEAFKTFSKHKPLRVVSVYGGVAIGPQMDALERADVVVATPGRLLDHLQRRTIDLSKVKTLVLDEADRMLDMGFIDDVKKIISQCPKKRQTLLFSATIHSKVVSMTKKYLFDPVTVSAKDRVDPRKLKQVFYNVQQNIKFSLLVHLLKNEQTDLVMVFCNTRTNTDFVAKNLRPLGIDATAIHGGLTQSKRSSIMKCFHNAKTCVLVCTDVAARGLDIPDVSHVYNYDIPNDSKEYIHRIGRTARAGKEGKVVNILSDRDHDNFRKVLSDNHLDIPQEEVPKVERVAIKKVDSPRRGGFGERRGHYGARGSGPRRGSGNRRSESSGRFGGGRSRDSDRSGSRGFGSRQSNDSERSDSGRSSRFGSGRSRDSNSSSSGRFGSRSSGSDRLGSSRFGSGRSRDSSSSASGRFGSRRSNDSDRSDSGRSSRFGGGRSRDSSSSSSSRFGGGRSSGRRSNDSGGSSRFGGGRSRDSDRSGNRRSNDSESSGRSGVREFKRTESPRKSFGRKGRR